MAGGHRSAHCASRCRPRDRALIAPRHAPAPEVAAPAGDDGLPGRVVRRAVEAEHALPAARVLRPERHRPDLRARASAGLLSRFHPTGRFKGRGSVKWHTRRACPVGVIPFLPVVGQPRRGVGEGFRHAVALDEAGEARGRVVEAAGRAGQTQRGVRAARRRGRGRAGRRSVRAARGPGRACRPCASAGVSCPPSARPGDLGTP